jgi:hypothetical protein
MSASTIVPRYAITPIDPKTGKFSRVWYEYFATLGLSVPSVTTIRDLQTTNSLDGATDDALGLQDRINAAALNTAALFTDADLPPRPDYSLLAWWP